MVDLKKQLLSQLNTLCDSFIHYQDTHEDAEFFWEAETNIRNLINSMEISEEQIFRRVQREYWLEDAKNAVDEYLSTSSEHIIVAITDKLLNDIVDHYEKYHDRNIDDNSQWNEAVHSCLQRLQERSQSIYIIRDREAGNYITYCDSLDEAKELVQSYEEEDKKDNCYEDDFYEIFEVDKNNIPSEYKFIEQMIEKERENPFNFDFEL